VNMGRDAVERRRQDEAAACRKVHEPFATIPASQIASARLRRLDGCAVRVLLMAHANWTPKKWAVLSVATIAGQLGVSRRSVSTAIRDLVAADLLTIVRPAKRPGTMGSGGRGAAAVYEVAGRRPGKAHLRFEPGDPRLDGALRILCTDLRKLAAMLTANEARILICLVLNVARDRHGAPQRSEPRPLSGRDAAKRLSEGQHHGSKPIHKGISARSADAAIAGLCQKGLLRLVTPASGRRAATYEPDGLATSVVRRGRKRANATTLSPAWNLQEGHHSAHKPGKPGGKTAGSEVRKAVVRSLGAGSGALCAEMAHGNNKRVGNEHSLSEADIMAALQLVAASPIERDTGSACPMPFAPATILIERGYIALVRRHLPGSDDRKSRRFYEITRRGQAALRKIGAAA
jgi:hypothetical protein